METAQQTSVALFKFGFDYNYRHLQRNFDMEVLCLPLAFLDILMFPWTVPTYITTAWATPQIPATRRLVEFFRASITHKLSFEMLSKYNP